MKKRQVSAHIRNIVLSYLIFGILWILFTDFIVASIIDDLALYHQFQSLKGIIFVIVTGIFLLYLLKINLKEIIEKENMLYQQAYFDSLTSLPNKSSLYQDLSQKIKNGQKNRVQFSFSIFYLDLSNIDNLTEIRGHTHGSDLIKKIAKALK